MSAAGVQLIIVIILAILFLLLTLCCCLYFCLKCRCVKATGLWYREPLFTYRKQGAWPWNTLEVSETSESGEGMSSAFGKAAGSADYYPHVEIPRARLARRDMDLDYADAAAYRGEVSERTLCTR